MSESLPRTIHGLPVVVTDNLPAPEGEVVLSDPFATPTEEMPDPAQNAGWRRMWLSWDFHRVALRGYPNCDLDGDHPPEVRLVVRKGQGKSSREMAQQFDDVCAGRFYYRDWTDSGLPFVDDGEAYRSCFVFQRRADKELFIRTFPDEVNRA